MTKRRRDEMTGKTSTLGPTHSLKVDANGTNIQESVTDSGAENKRRRTVLACSACRTRKTRCDGSRPVCSTCESQGYECVYAQPAYSDNVTVGRVHLFTLESRLSIPECKFKSLEQRNSHEKSLHLELPAERVDDTWQGADNARVIVDEEAVAEISGLDDLTDAPFTGFMKPSHFEGSVDNLEIIGEIPAEIDGTFYRVMPDPHFPPFITNDVVSATLVTVLPEKAVAAKVTEIVVQRRRKHKCFPHQRWQCRLQTAVRED